MYVQKIELQNTGPIDSVDLEFPIRDGRPIPVVFVGANGAGKSILLAHIVNALLVGKSLAFDDSELDEGKVYKYRHPQYIRSGENYSYGCVRFSYGADVYEFQLDRSRDAFERELGYTAAISTWNLIPRDQTSHFAATFDQHALDNVRFNKEQCCLFFPVNRFEQPAWLNVESLKLPTTFSERKQISRYSNRRIIELSPLRANRDWLFDVVFDREIYERQLKPILHTGVPIPAMINAFLGHSGPSTQIAAAVTQVLKVILREPGNIRIGVGGRRLRQLAIMRDEQIWIPNLFQLSTGEMHLLNLFVSIIRDFDHTESVLNSLADIKGVVVVDEIDSHLHTFHQRHVLPELIASFPNVQFILTSHSPLFLVGMEERFGSGGVTIYELPKGTPVSAVDFSEFDASYSAFKATSKHRLEIETELRNNSKPIVFVEGDYDVRYLRRAAELLGRLATLDHIVLKFADGYGNLDKVWKTFDNPRADALFSKLLLIYDCDTKKSPASKGLVIKRVVPTKDSNPIASGIENLFEAALIERIELMRPEFIDVQPATSKRVRGATVAVAAAKVVNKDEKGNLCDWLCEHGTAADFAPFEVVFDLIDEALGRT